MKRIVDDEHERVGRWMQERGAGDWREGAKCIGLEKDGRLIAGVMCDWWNGASIYMHVAGEGKRWLDREFLWFAFHYPFEQLKCNVVIGLVSSANEAALRFDRHLGFVESARIKHACPDGDLVVLTITKDQASRWLKLKEAQNFQAIRSTSS